MSPDWKSVPHATCGSRADMQRPVITAKGHGFDNIFATTRDLHKASQLAIHMQM